MSFGANDATTRHLLLGNGLMGLAEPLYFTVEGRFDEAHFLVDHAMYACNLLNGRADSGL
ncbi:MAG: hypothetical protein Q4D79_05810 [Propionibacteriaceae bacterium]|nr:hypothetical protein [Propionibacteriaceae bacterium]